MTEINEQLSVYPTNSTDLQQHQQQQNQIDDEEDDDVAGGESIDNPHIRFESHVLHDDGSVGPINGVEEGLHPHDFYTNDSEIVPVANNGGTDQLTLSFQGEVYVFDSITPEKVQAVLLLLGGYEVPTGISTIISNPQNRKASDDFLCRSSQPQRAASLSRFREKRKERCFDKKIRYKVRKEVALKMQRKKGQFTSSKSISDEGPSDGDGTTYEQETLYYAPALGFLMFDVGVNSSESDFLEAFNKPAAIFAGYIGQFVVKPLLGYLFGTISMILLRGYYWLIVGIFCEWLNFPCVFETNYSL